MRSFAIIIISLVCCYTTCFAQPRIVNDTLLNKKVIEYEKAEWNIHLIAAFTNPYDQKEISLDMVMTSPSGNPVVLPCYFDNGNAGASLWKARFAPQETGRYSYYFQLTVNKTVVTTTRSAFISLAGKKPGFLHKNGLYTFRFDDGELFRGIGENVGWESRSFEDPEYTYDYLLPTLSKNGANFFRTWMCPWNLPLEWKITTNPKRYGNTAGYFNPGGIKRMEELLKLTDSLHLYFMLTLDMNSGFWRNNPYNAANGGPVKTWAEFFTSTAAMDKYKNKLRYVIARWGYSTNIAAFEFFNEIDNGVFNKADSIIIPHSSITNWHEEMSRYLKDIDPYRHLVTTSISHRDITGLNSIPYIDFNQKHIYKHTEKIPAIYPDYIQTYGKPYVVGEFGYRWEDADPKYAADADYDYKRGLWFGLFSPTPILPMSWWWEFFDQQHMTPYLHSVRQISDMMLKNGNGSFEQVAASAGLLHVQAVKCGNTIFVYLLNESDSSITTPVNIPNMGKDNYTIRLFDPGNEQYRRVRRFTISNSALNIPQVGISSRKELVLIIKGHWSL